MKKVDIKGKLVREKKKNIMKQQIKKYCFETKNKIIRFFKNIKTKYDKMDKYFKQIIFVWIGVFIVIISAVILVSFSNKNLKKYRNMENAMNAVALDYVTTDELYGTKDKKVKIPLQSLVIYDKKLEKDIVNKSCNGYSIVYFDDEYEKHVVESYISCSKYTSKFYNDY